MSRWNKEQLENMLEDVVNELNLSDAAIKEHGPNGTPPAELVRLVLQQKDATIRNLRAGMKEVVTRNPLQLRENPRRERPYVANGVLTVRHPWVNGRTIRLGMKRKENQMLYRQLFERLIAAHPKTEDEWREELPPSMRRSYFKPMNPAIC